MRHYKRTVVAPGVFDILHIGHIRFLKKAKALGDYLIVSLLTSNAVAEFKDALPVMSFEERREILQSLRVVDAVVRQDQNDIEPLLRVLNPDILVRSESNKFNHGIDYMKNIGGEVVVLPRTKSISSSAIKGEIKSGE